MKKILFLSFIVQLLVGIRISACDHPHSIKCNAESKHTHSLDDEDIHSSCTWGGSGKVNRKFTPPASFLKNGVAKKSNILTIKSYFPSKEAEEAFDYAVSIWENSISSAVPIKIYAEWTRYMPAQALAGCSPSAYFKDFYGQQMPSTMYPMSLRNKLTYEETDDMVDIIISINANLENWYYGTDGETPAHSYDFVTVILHELAHGLGMQGLCTGYSFGSSGGKSYSIFDRHLEDKEGRRIDDNTLYPHNSEELFNVLRDSLVFNGELAKSANNNTKIGLYTNSQFQAGSSVYHLGDAFSDDDENALLTHQLDLGRAIHNPGPVLLAMLADMGWDVADIAHKVKDTDELDVTSKEIAFEVSSEYLVEDIKVYYQKLGETSFIEAELNHLGGSEYTALLTNLVYGNDYRYYIEVSDEKMSESRTFYYPANAVIKPSVFTFGSDSESPELIYATDKASVWFPYNNSFNVEAIAFDNYELENISVVVTIDGVEQQAVALNVDAESGLYSGDVFLPEGLSRESEVKYQVIATDKASIPNVDYLPSADTYYEVEVATFTALDSDFVTDFDSDDAGIDFYLDGMRIISPSNDFDSKSLNTAHPYDIKKDYTATFAYEITVKNGTKISYDEIAIVEPSKGSYEYPSPYFYDYVALEASHDQGKTWVPIGNVYDAGDFEPWKELWNSWLATGDNVPQNSLAFPKPDLYVTREIDLVNDTELEDGDNVLIRFRLSSDYIIYGWGWCIDNLEIVYEEPDVSVRKNTINSINIAPNPVTDYFMIQEAGNFYIDIYNVTGSKIRSLNTSGFTPIYIGDFANGVYIVNIKGADGFVSKKILKQ